MMPRPRIRPFFCYYGAKWLSAPRYPQPYHPIIIEPFAGAAGYSMLYYDRDIRLFEIDPIIYGIWDFLIHARERDILSIPNRVSHISEVSAFCQEIRWLVGFWLNPGSSQPKNTRGTWASATVDSDVRYWSPRIQERIVQQLPCIRHWTITHGHYLDHCPDIEATWFIDPPYYHAGRHYTYRLQDDDYDRLSAFCQVIKGQVIVCEGNDADWLPFQHFRFGKAAKYGISYESIWHRPM